MSREKREAMSEMFPNGDTREDESLAEDTVGGTCSVMKLWEGRSPEDRVVWLPEPPEAKQEEKSSSESPGYAITLLHRDLHKTGEHKLDTIIMRSSELQNFLHEIIPNISSYYDESEQGISIRGPFRLLFWHLDQIDAAANGANKKLGEVATLLQSVLMEEFHDILAKRKELLTKQEMNFDTLWTIFKPGMTCLTGYDRYITAVKVTAIDFSRDPMGNVYYRIKFRNLGWDGECLGWQDSYTDIFEFRGRQKIKDLDIYPIEYHPDPNIIGQLVSRGKSFVEITVKEPHLMSFNGETLDRESSPMWWQGEQKKLMSERVVLDARAYNHYYRRLNMSKWLKRGELNDALAAKEPDKEIFLYCCPEYYCFALQRKKWARVWIEDLDEVVFNDSAYPNLVLPGDYKELLLSFAEAQIDGYGFDDIIAGKGQGILMLLAGPPGTGKTLTAEAMGEHMKRPLYSVSAGELAASSGGMETALDKVLELSTRWNAVLLLDEADVFLQKRTDTDLQRNTVVSVFLRKLEYYRGIMFLTTNRIASFDDAFKSRIHIAIRYPDLDTHSRRLIWENFLKKAQDLYMHGVNVSKEEVDQLAQKALNGREIRNIVKSAQLLASRSKQPLRKSHLDTVWRVEHEDSPWHLHNGDDR